VVEKIWIKEFLGLKCKIVEDFPRIFEFIYKGPAKATRGGVNGSQSKFLCKNWPMSQVQTPKPKPYKKVMNTPTNIIEMTPQSYECSEKRMELIGHPVSKI
jgi:hypothetical protein